MKVDAGLVEPLAEIGDQRVEVAGDGRLIGAVIASELLADALQQSAAVAGG